MLLQIDDDGGNLKKMWTIVPMQPSTPKMTRAQAKIFWNSLSSEQRKDFIKMMGELEDGKLMLSYVGVDDNEQIQHIVLDPKEKTSKPIEPFAKHFTPIITGLD